MFSTRSNFMNDGRLVIDGSFQLSAGAAVITQTNPDGSTFTVTGQGLSVAKTGAGTFQVTAKTSNMDQGPVFQPVQLLDADANLVGPAFAGATAAAIGGVPTVNATTGDIQFNVLTTADGAVADTTDAVTVTFSVVIVFHRMASPL
jgi:hypothetical protein